MFSVVVFCSCCSVVSFVDCFRLLVLFAIVLFFVLLLFWGCCLFVMPDACVFDIMAVWAAVWLVFFS